MRHPSLTALIALAVTLPPALALAPPPKRPTATWAQWRGPTRDGRLPGDGWPASLKGLEQRWRVDLAEGYPGPIVADDRVFVVETKGKSDEVVRALDRRTGKQLWEASWKGSMTVPFFAASNGSWVRSTPAYDGESLFVAGMRDVLVCLDAKTGQVRWRADLMDRYKTALPAFGFVCSPLVDGDAVYVQAAASVLKLDKETGKTLWRSLDDGGGMYGSAFSSPVIATLAGRRQFVVQTRTTLAGLGLDKGEVLWKQAIPATRGMNILTPAVYKDSIFTSAYGAKTYRFLIEKDGDKFAVKTAWTLNFDANMSSPVIVGQYAYLHRRDQRVSCIDLESGQAKWTTSRTYGKYWSLVARGEKILALDQRGTLYLIKASADKLEVLDERRVSQQETWGHLAVAGDELFVRELKGLVAYRWEEAGAAGK